MPPEITEFVLDPRLTRLSGRHEPGRQPDRCREVLGRSAALGGAADLVIAREDTSSPTQWHIEDSRHSLIIHLGGSMRRLETRVQGAPTCHQVPVAGDIWLVPAGRRYNGMAIGSLITYLELQLAPEALASIFGSTDAAARDLSPQLKVRDATLHAMANAAARLCGQPDDLAKLGQEAYTHAISLHLLRLHSRRGARPLDRQEANVLASAPARARLERYVREHLAERLTLAGLAAAAGVGTHRLLRDFRSAYGLTPIQYVIATRLQHACELLRRSRLEITDIAISCGFASHSHLSSVFRARLGLTPGQYRRSYRVV